MWNAWLGGKKWRLLYLQKALLVLPWCHWQRGKVLAFPGTHQGWTGQIFFPLGRGGVGQGSKSLGLGRGKARVKISGRFAGRDGSFIPGTHNKLS